VGRLRSKPRKRRRASAIPRAATDAPSSAARVPSQLYVFTIYLTPSSDFVRKVAPARDNHLAHSGDPRLAPWHRGACQPPRPRTLFCEARLLAALPRERLDAGGACLWSSRASTGRYDPRWGEPLDLDATYARAFASRGPPSRLTSGTSSRSVHHGPATSFGEPSTLASCTASIRGERGFRHRPSPWRCPR
jgi:hypothetical protein